MGPIQCFSIDKTVGKAQLQPWPCNGRIISPTLKIDCPQSSGWTSFRVNRFVNFYFYFISQFSIIYMPVWADEQTTECHHCIPDFLRTESCNSSVPPANHKWVFRSLGVGLDASSIVATCQVRAHHVIDWSSVDLVTISINKDSFACRSLLICFRLAAASVMFGR